MPRIARRTTLALASAAVLAGLAPVTVAMVAAQIQVCYAVTCSTVDGQTRCYEKKVPCPKET
jgi:hypothetical protein